MYINADNLYFRKVIKQLNTEDVVLPEINNTQKQDGASSERGPGNEVFLEQTYIMLILSIRFITYFFVSRMYWMISTRKIVQIGRTKSTAYRWLMCKKSMILEMMVMMMILGMFLIGTDSANVLRYEHGQPTFSNHSNTNIY
jgi:hypothetical protein